MTKATPLVGDVLPGEIEVDLSDVIQMWQELAQFFKQFGERENLPPSSDTARVCVADTVLCQGDTAVEHSTPVLRFWHIHHEQAYGMVLDHPRFTDGTWVRTSRVITCDGIRLATLHRRYRLQAPKKWR